MNEKRLAQPKVGVADPDRFKMWCFIVYSSIYATVFLIKRKKEEEKKNKKKTNEQESKARHEEGKKEEAFAD